MSLIQNSQQYHIEPSKDTNPLEPDSSDCQQPKRDKSIPKFNRRGESRSNQRKKSQASSKIDHRICYLSPAKNTSGSNFNVNTSIAITKTFEDVKHRFAVNNKDLFSFDPTRSAKGFDCRQLTEKECCEGCEGNLQEKCKEIERLKSRIQTLQLQVRLQTEKAEALQIKLQEFQQARTFLLEREGFISQILENNILLNENLMKCEAEKRVMEEHFGVLLQEKLEFQKEYERQSQQWSERFKSKNQEIANLIRNSKKMQVELVGKVKGKKEKGKEKEQNAFKENQDKCNIARLAKSKSRDSFNPSKQTTEFFAIDPNIIPEVQPQQKASFNLSFEDDPHKQQQQKLIKKLQEKIRYSEIQIDVLKKIKEDSTKLSKNNETLKSQNQKLLKRIDYLSRQCSKRPVGSDSSLELSLSPRRS